MNISLFLNNPLNIINLAFFATLVIFVWYAFAIIYHFIRFGVGKKTKVMALLFFIGSCIFSAVIFSAYRETNWAITIEQIRQIFINLIKS